MYITQVDLHAILPDININLINLQVAMSLNNFMYLYSAGAVYVPAGAKEFVSGDRVKCDLDMEVLSIATAVGEGANDQISMVGYMNSYAA